MTASIFCRAAGMGRWWRGLCYLHDIRCVARRDNLAFWGFTGVDPGSVRGKGRAEDLSVKSRRTNWFSRPERAYGGANLPKINGNQIAAGAVIEHDALGRGQDQLSSLASWISKAAIRSAIRDSCAAPE
jgi:hypothetical protein